MEIIVLHDKYTNEPIIVRISTMSPEDIYNSYETNKLA